MCENSRTSITNCTFTLNSSAYCGGVAFWDPLNPVTLENNIIAYSNGSPLETDNIMATFNINCCDLFGNSPGNWLGFFGGFENTNGNFSEDPLFCNTAGIELYLSGSSPCAPANNDCGTLIGALEVGCSSCCVGFTGNADCSESEDPDITDITVIIDHLYLSHKPLCCLEEADIDLSGEIDITDITKIIDFLYLSHTPLTECP
jgi:hypothetical protein